MDTRFVRMSSPSVAIQVHVSPDARYVLLPQLERATRITGWVIYDTTVGMVLTAHELGLKRGNGVFDSMHAARDYITNTLERRPA